MPNGQRCGPVLGLPDRSYFELYDENEIKFMDIYGNEFAQYQFGNQFYQTIRPEGYDYNIKWEETTTINAGLEFGFAKDRLFGTIDIYQRKTKDLLNYIPVPAGTNLTNFLFTNVGDLENKGIELSVTGRPIVKDNMFWEITLNTTYNKNKITKLTASDDSTYLGVLTGGIAGGVGNTIQIHSVGYSTSSVFVYEQVYDAAGMPVEGMYVDSNGDKIITDADRYHYEKPAADITIGIASRFNYKNWDFSFSGRANLGNYVYDNMNSNNGVYERLYRPEGPYLSNITSAVSETGFVVPQYLSDFYIKEASFFKMDNVSLAYTFKKFFKDKVALKLSATVNNAFTITNYKGLDPEIGNGIDNNMYPRTRAFVFGVNLQF
jgi:iron complex outermembrane receptor protein